MRFATTVTRVFRLPILSVDARLTPSVFSCLVANRRHSWPFSLTRKSARKDFRSLKEFAWFAICYDRMLLSLFY